MENENRHPNQSTSPSDETEHNPEINQNTETRQNPEKTPNQKASLDIVSKQNPEKSKRTWKIVVGVVALVAAFILGSVVTILVQRITGQDNGPELPWENNHDLLKPMIYLYPEQKTIVDVQLGNPSKLTATYPKYNNGWKVTAEPDGTLHDTAGREYYGLYWEGTSGNATIHQEGFVIAGEDTAKFLEEKLALLGLTEREANEFIVYWLPKLEANRYNYIRFETEEEINEYMPLEVTPTPDTVLRILMDYKPLDAPIEVKEQNLTTPTREGFTLVEWGGTEIGDNIVE